MKRPLAIALALLAPLPGAALPAPAMAQQVQQVLNLQDADIRAFIQDVARATGMTLVVDPRVQGKVTVTSQEPLDRSELFDILLSTLRANGLVAIPAGAGAYRIAPEEGAAQQPASAGSAGQGFATQVFRLRHVEAQAAAETLKPLVGRQGVIVPSPRGNVLVVSDYGDNLRRVRGLVSQIDVDRSQIRTVALNAIPAREAAQIVNELLRAPGSESQSRNGLVSVVIAESSNTLILRGASDAIGRLLPVIADLDQRAETGGEVRVIRLQYADAEQILPVLQQMVGQSPASQSPEGRSQPAAAAGPAPGAVLGGGRANIARYPGANALVIGADPTLQKALADVVRQLDVRREQVLVEAIVVEISDEAAKALGVQFALAGANSSSVPFVANAFPTASPNLMTLLAAAGAKTELPADSGTLDALQAGAANALLGARGTLVGGGGPIGEEALFGVIINAVRNDTASNLLSTPSILTMDNQEATILVGQEVPVTTGEVLGSANSNPFRTIQRQNVGVQLEVRPQINAGGVISLHLRQEVSSVAGPVSAVSSELVLNKREIQTTVSVDDGEIVVLGGLIGRDERLLVERTPVLGDLPVLGNLFRSTSRDRGKTNLMVFIRPTIVRDRDGARAVTGPRYAWMRDRQREAGTGGADELDRLLRDYMGVQPLAGEAPTVLAPAPQTSGGGS